MTTTDDVEEAVTYPHEEQALIRHLTGSMEWLQELKASVEHYGVSRNDLQAVVDIRDGVAGRGETLEPSTAMESFPIQGYTEERSSLNQAIGVESISQTLVSTIKALIRKLSEYITKMIRWFRQKIQGEKTIGDKLKRHSELVEQMRVKNAQLEKQHKPSQECIERDKKLAGELLMNDGLQRNMLYAAALGHRDLASRIDRFSDTVMDQAAGLKVLVEDLERLLSGKTDEVEIHDNAMTVLGMQAQESEVLRAPMPSNSYLIQEVGVGVFDQTLIESQKTITPYDYLMKLYEDLGDQLKRIRKIENDDDVDKITSLLKDLPKSIDHLAWIAHTLREYNKAKLQSMKILHGYEREHFRHLYEDAYKQHLLSSKQNVIERIRKEVESLISKLMR